MQREKQSDGTNWGGGDAELCTIFGRALIERDLKARLISEVNGRLLWSSPSADRLLRRPSPVYLEDHRLCFENGHASRDGEAFLSSLQTRPGRLFVTNCEDNCWVLVSGWAHEAKDRQLLFLTFNPSQPMKDSISSGLAAHFELTKAEAAVLDEFARLRNPMEIAEQLQVTMNTVRSHLRRIHAKMEVNSNVRLLQIVRAFADS